MEHIAATQKGLVTRGQLLEIGFSADAIEKMIRRGRLFELHPRTYALGGVPRTWDRDLYAAQLWAGPDCAIYTDPPERYGSSRACTGRHRS